MDTCAAKHLRESETENRGVLTQQVRHNSEVTERREHHSNNAAEVTAVIAAEGVFHTTTLLVCFLIRTTLPT